MRRSLVGVHVLLHADDGSFLSSLDPPEFARRAIASCTNRQHVPVLIGDEGDDTTVLSSPIILYDRPEVADESPGDMCDATEIDEILALRVLTLTDEEKTEARATDPRAAAIVDRVDDFAPEIFERLHGAIRSLRPAPEKPLPWWEPAVDAAVDPWTDTIRIDDVEVSKGSKVKLRPGSRRTDAQDLFLVGRVATVEGVFSDVDGDQHLAVTLDDDPAAELHQWHGRFLYFHPDEAEPVPMTGTKTLVAGIGNIFNGDDGFGSEVARRLAGRPMPEGVRVEDYGIRGRASRLRAARGLRPGRARRRAVCGETRREPSTCSSPRSTSTTSLRSTVIRWTRGRCSARSRRSGRDRTAAARRVRTGRCRRRHRLVAAGRRRRRRRGPCGPRAHRTKGMP